MKDVWVSLDGVRERAVEQYVNRLVYLKSQDLLDRVLISHDAGWYRPGEHGGGNFRPYTDINKYLIPALTQAGFTKAEITQLFEVNPASAFSISICLLPD